MKIILISVKPKYVADILNGKKTIEIRKTMPKCDLPIDVYIYCTKDKKYANLINRGGFLTGMVVAKFTLNKAEEIIWEEPNKLIFPKDMLKNACLSGEELFKYLGTNGGYAWHISNLVIFDKPKELSEFKTLTSATAIDCTYHTQKEKCKRCGKRFNSCKIAKPLTKAPQSWCYVEVE